MDGAKKRRTRKKIQNYKKKKKRKKLLPKKKMIRNKNFMKMEDQKLLHQKISLLLIYANN